jgi:ubiquitin-conjugating enzyme E2 J2
VQDPIPNILAQPDPSNILEWHFVITGEPGTPYARGTYHGKLLFPPDYPFKPPGIIFMTPSGRFKPGERICFSFSDFHPEEWNPIWHVATILNATQSFMNEESQTSGSTTASRSECTRLAEQSLANSCKNPAFRRMFPHLVEENRLAQQRDAQPQPSEVPASTSGVGGNPQATQILAGVEWGVDRGAAEAAGTGQDLIPQFLRTLPSLLVAVLAIGIIVGQYTSSMS